MDQEILKLAGKVLRGLACCASNMCNSCEYDKEPGMCTLMRIQDMQTIYKAILAESWSGDKPEPEGGKPMPTDGKPKTVKITISADKELSAGLKKAYWRERVCAQAVGHFGQTHQILKAMEELGELTAALSRCVNQEGAKTSGEHRRDILSELADVEIMCQQLERIFGGAQEERDYKLARLEKRMAGERGDGD